jgi:hypothetical protein
MKSVSKVNIDVTIKSNVHTDIQSSELQYIHFIINNTHFPDNLFVMYSNVKCMHACNK